jgi:hypothetical protein
MNRIVKRAIILYVFVASIALMAALPGVLGAPQAAPAGQAASDTSVLSESSLETSAVDQNALESAAVSETGTQASPEAEITPDGWEIIVPGIEYREFHLSDPNNVYVARMLRSNQEVILESSIAMGRLASGRESVTGMADRYNQAINNWGEEWGHRNRVVVAINGYYFDPATGVPQRGQINSSWYAKRFDELQNGSGLAWKTDRSVFIGECVKNPADKQVVTFLETGTTQAINGINQPRGDNELILYTPQYDADTNTGDDPKSVEAIVELTKPVTAVNAVDMITGTVKSIRKNIGSAPIPFDHVVISARGSVRDALFDVHGLSENDVIGVTQRIVNCNASLPIEWKGTYASIGGHFHFLKNSSIQSYPDNQGAITRHPRTAIAYNEQYLFFIVVDGRDPYASVGMSIDELAIFARDYLSATDAVAEDGGGSSTMVVNGEVKNNTFCGNFYKPYEPNVWPGGCVKVFLPVTTQSTVNGQDQTATTLNQPPTLLPAPPDALDDDSEIADTNAALALDANTGTIERLVANGMLMVLVEPITRTISFSPGDLVTAFSSTDVRLGPGTNYGKLGTLNAGDQGSVIDHVNGLNGVLATGYNWWKVQFGGLVGWVTEQSLTPPSQSSLIDQKPGIYR